MTFLPKNLHKANPAAVRSGPVGVASATQRFHLKMGFIGDHRHSRIREYIFSLRPREQLKPLD